MSASDPRLEALDDYLSGALGDAGADAFEDALFADAAEGRAPELMFLDRLRAGFLDLHARGSFSITYTPSQARELERTSKYRVKLFNARTFRGDPAKELAALDVVLLELNVDLAGAERIDLELGTRAHGTVLTIPDIDFDPAQDAIVLACERELALASQGLNGLTKIVSVKGNERRVLAEYGFEQLTAAP